MNSMLWIVFGILLLAGLFYLYVTIRDIKLLKTITKLNRGTKSERKLVLKLLKFGIPAQTIFHDLYVKKFEDNYSQVDLVVATRVGIIVFEVKDYSGWIFGDARNTQWTKVLAYGKEKYRFYNPIMQNNKHIEVLKNQLRLENIPFYSVIVFYGNCELKDVSNVPFGTCVVNSKRVLEAMDIILNDNDPARYTDKNEVVRVLKEAVKNGESKEIQNRHVENINRMLRKERIYD